MIIITKEEFHQVSIGTLASVSNIHFLIYLFFNPWQSFFQVNCLCFLRKEHFFVTPASGHYEIPSSILNNTTHSNTVCICEEGCIYIYFSPGPAMRWLLPFLVPGVVLPVVLPFISCSWAFSHAANKLNAAAFTSKVDVFTLFQTHVFLLFHRLQHTRSISPS